MPHPYSDSFSQTITRPVELLARNLVTSSPSLGCPRLIVGLIATLHPPVRSAGVPYSGRYSVTFRGQLIVDDSCDPECDLARALLERGFAGLVTVLDETGKPRSRVNIQKAAKLLSEEGPFGPRFVRHRTVVDRDSTAESEIAPIPKGGMTGLICHRLVI